MTYLLTVWLLVAGQWMPGQVAVASADECTRVVEQTAKNVEAVVWTCALAVEV